MEDDSNTGKGDKQIGSPSNQEISFGQENAPAPTLINVDATMRRMGESSSGTGRAQLRALWLQWAGFLHGYGKGKRRIDSIYNTCSTDFNPSSAMRRRPDGSPLDVERRPLTRFGREHTLSQLPSLPRLMPGGNPGPVPIQPPTTIGKSDPPFISLDFPDLLLPEHGEPVPMPTYFEDSDQDADTSTPAASSSNDEMIDADSDTAGWEDIYSDTV